MGEKITIAEYIFSYVAKHPRICLLYRYLFIIIDKDNYAL